MNDIATLMDRLALQEGFNTTHLDGVRVYKTSEKQPRQPLCYEQGVIIVGQGTKRIYLGETVYQYDRENYLVLSVPLPAECETEAEKDKPFLALVVDIPLEVINRIIGELNDCLDDLPIDSMKKTQGLFVAKASPDFSDTVFRLLRCLISPMESRVLGKKNVYELMYRILMGENASTLYALAIKNTQVFRINRALKQIHSAYYESMDVDLLARLVNMSPSAFHRAFKDVTALSPIQYLKKIRLDKAKTMLLGSDVRVGEAAAQVGYESASQFSREFKRHFGMNPVCYVENRNQRDYQQA